MPELLGLADELVVTRAELVASGSQPSLPLAERKALEASFSDLLDRIAGLGVELKGWAPLLVDFRAELGGPGGAAVLARGRAGARPGTTTPTTASPDVGPSTSSAPDAGRRRRRPARRRAGVDGSGPEAQRALVVLLEHVGEPSGGAGDGEHRLGGAERHLPGDGQGAEGEVDVGLGRRWPRPRRSVARARRRRRTAARGDGGDRGQQHAGPGVEAVVEGVAEAGHAPVVVDGALHDRPRVGRRQHVEDHPVGGDPRPAVERAAHRADGRQHARVRVGAGGGGDPRRQGGAGELVVGQHDEGGVERPPAVGGGPQRRQAGPEVVGDGPVVVGRRHPARAGAAPGSARRAGPGLGGGPPRGGGRPGRGRRRRPPRWRGPDGAPAGAASSRAASAARATLERRARPEPARGARRVAPAGSTRAAPRPPRTGAAGQLGDRPAPEPELVVVEVGDGAGQHHVDAAGPAPRAPGSSPSAERLDLVGVEEAGAAVGRHTARSSRPRLT